MRRAFIGVAGADRADSPQARGGGRDRERHGRAASRSSSRTVPPTRAGLLPGDVVTRLDGVGINGVDDLIRALDRDRIGRTLEMEVLRMGRARAIEIHPIERKPVVRQAR